MDPNKAALIDSINKQRALNDEIEARKQQFQQDQQASLRGGVGGADAVITTPEGLDEMRRAEEVRLHEVMTAPYDSSTDPGNIGRLPGEPPREIGLEGNDPISSVIGDLIEGKVGGKLYKFANMFTKPLPTIARVPINVVAGGLGSLGIEELLGPAIRNSQEPADPYRALANSLLGVASEGLAQRLSPSQNGGKFPWSRSGADKVYMESKPVQTSFKYMKDQHPTAFNRSFFGAEPVVPTRYGPNAKKILNTVENLVGGTAKAPESRLSSTLASSLAPEAGGQETASLIGETARKLRNAPEGTIDDLFKGTQNLEEIKSNAKNLFSKASAARQTDIEGLGSDLVVSRKDFQTGDAGKILDRINQFVKGRSGTSFTEKSGVKMEKQLESFLPPEAKADPAGKDTVKSFLDSFKSLFGKQVSKKGTRSSVMTMPELLDHYKNINAYRRYALRVFDSGNLSSLAKGDVGAGFGDSELPTLLKDLQNLIRQEILDKTERAGFGEIGISAINNTDRAAAAASVRDLTGQKILELDKALGREGLIANESESLGATVGATAGFAGPKVGRASVPSGVIKNAIRRGTGEIIPGAEASYRISTASQRAAENINRLLYLRENPPSSALDLIPKSGYRPEFLGRGMFRMGLHNAGQEIKSTALLAGADAILAGADAIKAGTSRPNPSYGSLFASLLFPGIIGSQVDPMSVGDPVYDQPVDNPVARNERYMKIMNALGNK